VRSEEDSLFSIVATIGQSNLSDADNAMLARNVVQKLLDIFREEHIVGNRAGIDQGVAELNEQLEERKLELEAAEERRLAFEAQYPDLIGGSATLSSKLQQARTELRDVEADLAAAQSALAALDAQLGSTPRTIVGGANDVGPRAALLEAQTQLAELRARGLKDVHPDVVATTKQVDILTRQVASVGSDAAGTPNPAYSSLLAIKADRQAAVEASQARRAAIQSQVASLVASQASEPAIAAEANRISRDYEVLRKNYEDLLQNRENLRTRGDVEDQTSQFRFTVTDPPVVPQKPAAPNRPLLLFGILVVGAGAGATAAYGVGQLRSTFTTAQSLQNALDLPVIGSISLTASQALKTLERQRLKQFAAACAGLVGIFVILLAIEIISIGTVA
ncbi:MAG: chain-length determining protein, partial [Pseudomonadota bacterium]